MARAHDRLGFVLGQQGRTVEAVERFREAVRLDPKLADAHYHLGATLWWMGQRPTHWHHCAGPSSCGPITPRRSTTSAWCCGNSETLTRPCGICGKRFDSNPSIRGGAHAAGRGPAGARRPGRRRGGARARHWRSIRRSRMRRTASDWYGCSWGRGTRRLRLFNAILARNPDNETARHNLGTVFMHKGDLKTAVEVYQELTRRNPYNAEAFYNLGLALKQQDDFAGGGNGADAGHGARFNAAGSAVYAGRGVVADRSCESRPSRRSVRRSRRSRTTPRPTTCSAPSCRQQGRTDEALAEFRKSIELQPESAEAYLSLGQLLQRRGEARRVSAALREAERLNRVKADEQAAAFALNRGVEKLGRGDVAGAIVDLREAVRLGPDLPRAHYQLALALRRQGAQRRGTSAFRRGAATRTLPRGAQVELT